MFSSASSLPRILPREFLILLQESIQNLSPVGSLCCSSQSIYTGAFITLVNYDTLRTGQVSFILASLMKYVALSEHSDVGWINKWMGAFKAHDDIASILFSFSPFCISCDPVRENSLLLVHTPRVPTSVFSCSADWHALLSNLSPYGIREVKSTISWLNQPNPNLALISMWPWVSHFTYLCLNFLIYIIKIIGPN